MFFRETRSTNSNSTVLQLVENIRTDNGPRQRLVVSLGTTFKILKKDRRAVATMVENRLRGNQTSLFEDDPAHVAYADKIIKKIQVEGKWESTREKVQQFKRGILSENNTAPTAHVFINDVNHGYTRELGPVLIKRLVNTHAYSTIQLPTTQGTVINIRKPGITEGIHQALYEKLEVELSRLPTTRNLA